jgi:hypothetical protein
MTAPEVVALVNSNFGFAEAQLSGPDASMDGARDACLAAEAARPDSAWARICRAAVIVEPLKFEPEPCEPDKYAEASTLLNEAEELQPELAALYYWQAVILYQRANDCPPPLADGDFEMQCNDREQQLALRREAGQALLFLHQWLLNKFPDCAK